MITTTTMVRDSNRSWPPIGSPMNLLHRDDDLLQQQQQHWTNFDSSVNAVSFGFVATAILISMFLVMAIFERFFRPASPALSPSSSRRRFRRDGDPQMGFSGKLAHPSPKMSLYPSWVSVMMPGDEIPTFIAQPAPAPGPTSALSPCCPERISWPSHQHHALHSSPPSTTFGQG